MYWKSRQTLCLPMYWIKRIVAQATRLSAVLESVPMQKRQEIFAVVEIMANGRL